jgi:hypothetical protein
MNGYPLKIAGMSVEEMTGPSAAEIEVSYNALIRQILGGRIKRRTIRQRRSAYRIISNVRMENVTN